MDKQKVKQTREKLIQLYPQISIPDASYLILETPRSGSTLLSTHLQKIGHGFPLEAFNPSANYRKRFNLMTDDSNPVEYVRQAIEAQTRNGVMGTKFHRSQFKNFQRIAMRLLAFTGLTFTEG